VPTSVAVPNSLKYEFGFIVWFSLLALQFFLCSINSVELQNLLF